MDGGRRNRGLRLRLNEGTWILMLDLYIWTTCSIQGVSCQTSLAQSLHTNKSSLSPGWPPPWECNNFRTTPQNLFLVSEQNILCRRRHHNPYSIKSLSRRHPQRTDLVDFSSPCRISITIITTIINEVFVLLIFQFNFPRRQPSPGQWRVKYYHNFDIDCEKGEPHDINANSLPHPKCTAEWRETFSNRSQLLCGLYVYGHNLGRMAWYDEDNLILSKPIVDGKCHVICYLGDDRGVGL